jgi:Ca2+-binding RTX toxin-like protein
LHGGPGDDALRSDGDLLFGGPGRDIMRMVGNGYIAKSGEGDDDVAYVGDAGKPYLHIDTDEGNDKISIRGTARSDIYPGAGDDTVEGGPGIDWVSDPFERGTDTFRTYAGDDRIGSDGASGDEFRLGSGNDYLDLGGVLNNSPSQAYAGPGDDTAGFYWRLWPTRVADVFVDGGLGQDTLRFEYLDDETGAGAGMIVDLTAGTATHHGNSFIVPNFDHAVGSPLDDEMYGNSGDNTFSGGPGNDELVGKGGDDVLVGEGGSDSANGGPGTDRCDAETTADCEEQRTE